MLLKEPTITVKEIALEDISLSELTLSIVLEVDNPNLFGITFSSITGSASFLHDGEYQPLSTMNSGEVTIERGINTVTIPVHAKNIDLLKAGFTLFTDREITIRIEGIASPSFFGISPEIPFSDIKTIPLP
ncbi:MAG: LEA type 2 family protein [Methanospirillaceae archaeon]|nr:LEA type 2 family protein [Methanospirillaceae archaeon]